MLNVLKYEEYGAQSTCTLAFYAFELTKHLYALLNPFKKIITISTSTISTIKHLWTYFGVALKILWQLTAIQKSAKLQSHALSVLSPQWRIQDLKAVATVS